MYQFRYEYMKPKYIDNAKLCYSDTDSFIMHIKTENFFKYIPDDVEKRSDISNYEYNSVEFDRPLSKGKNKKR